MTWVWERGTAQSTHVSFHKPFNKPAFGMTCMHRTTPGQPKLFIGQNADSNNPLVMQLRVKFVETRRILAVAP